MRYQAYYYLKASGKAPLEEYLKKIKDIKTLFLIESLIKRLVNDKCDLPSVFIKPVFKKVYELRLAHHENQIRVFYFIFKKGKIILLDGYTKKTQKIPKRILKRVKKYYFDYLKHQYGRVYIGKTS